MKRILQLALVMGVMCVLAGAADAGGGMGGHWKFVDLKWRTTLTSSTTPTYASQWGGGANTGAHWVDSLSISAIGGASTDTSVAFTLDDLAPYSGPVLKATGVAGVGQRTSVTDTSRAIVITYYPAPQSANVEEMTATDDLILDGSFDGSTWFALMTGKSFTELTSANDHFVVELKSDRYYGGTTGWATDTSDETTWWGLPYYRIRMTGTINGTYMATLRYWAED